jgi:hypothetical protein
MMIVSDLGCARHQSRQLRLFGPEAQVMHDLIANLQGNQDYRTYICGYGHSHRLVVELDVPGMVAGLPQRGGVVRHLKDCSRPK